MDEITYCSFVPHSIYIFFLILYEPVTAHITGTYTSSRKRYKGKGCGGFYLRQTLSERLLPQWKELSLPVRGERKLQQFLSSTRKDMTDVISHNIAFPLGLLAIVLITLLKHV